MSIDEVVIMRKVFIKYDRKPPYLPVAIGDTKSDLARALGVSPDVVMSAYSHKQSTYWEVEIEDEEENVY